MADELTGDDDLVLHAGDVSDPAAYADVAAVALKRFAALDALIHWGGHSSARFMTGEVMHVNGGSNLG